MLTEREQALADKLVDAGPDQNEAESWVEEVVQAAYIQGFEDARS